MRMDHYCQLAGLFDFPAPGFAAKGRQLLNMMRERYPQAAGELEQFLGAIPDSTLDLQELHTRTFDVQSLTTLDLGYVLFGDDYKRGELLSNLTREHAQAGVDCAGELADHLPNVLRLIAALEDEDLRSELVRNILVPAIMLMAREFEPERIQRKNTSYQEHYKTLIEPARGGNSTVYSKALKAVLGVLVADFQLGETVSTLSNWNRRPQSVDFLGLVEREMEIERSANPVNSGCDA
ncbi:MAG: hypothetical protein A3G25_02620 [Betaproteobacteria bacterium RIFCSPLOWO2_12_FULL_63_13]|nr:MAG: hypothetical protein A3H32_15365 [Betaproteobacteria bacterium RIFCSPLOWO2_02_FULL_63_19]OGA44196.1 MAG: hypothetical protein A3G25_02620 [Betaproteobacteria bacterium RIFCSPLOWO2_12_FULL_63_13]